MKKSRRETIGAFVPATFRRVLPWIVLSVGLVLAYSWMSPDVLAPNEKTRLYLALSIAESGELHIDAQVARYGKLFDLAERDGHFYSDKAPGASVIAVPFLWAYRLLGGSDSIEKLLNFSRTFIMVPIALLSFMWLRAILVRLGLGPPRANATAIAFALGTSFFHYGTSFFGHAMVTWAALGAGWALLRAADAAAGRRRVGWQVFAGFMGGLAFSFEYQAFVICAGIAVAFLSVRENRKPSAVLAPLAGAILPIVLTLFYNKVAFGGFFETSYAHLHYATSQQIHSKGLFGVMWPTLEGLYGLLISPSRGLLLCAPIVALGLFGLPALWRRNRAICLYAGISMAGYLFIIAGFPVWYGGWGFGPRMLVPIFGLAAIAGGVLWEDLRDSKVASGAIAAYLIAGIAYNISVTTMFPEVPHAVKAPLKTVALPIAKLGKPGPNFGSALLGMEGLVSLLPLALIVVGLGVYIWRCQPAALRRSLRSVSALVLVIFFFGLVALGYPESQPPQAADKLVNFLSSKRHEAR